MTTKQKIFIDRFHIHAGVLFSFLLFFALTVFSVAQEAPTSDKSIFADQDRDGISDAEEKVFGTDPLNSDTDGDSYSDGVEIASGYDPLAPAPGDRLIKEYAEEAQSALSEEDKGNATKKLSADLADFVQQQQSEGVGGLEVDDITKAAEESLRETVAFSGLPEVDIARIKIKDQRYPDLSKKKRKEKLKEDSIEYFTNVMYVLLSNAPEAAGDPSDIERIAARTSLEISLFSSGASTYFQDFAHKGKDMIKELGDVEVPEQHLETHIRGLKLGQYASSLEEELEPNTDDPLATINTLAKMQGLIGLASDFAFELEDSLEKLGIRDLEIEL